jgi:hypothetical protein
MLLPPNKCTTFEYVERNSGTRLADFSVASFSLARSVCRRVNAELLVVLSDENRSQHERYLAAYRLIHKRDKEIGRAFNDFRRSTAVFQIAIIRKLGVINDEELGRFGKEVRASLAYFSGEDHGSTAAE